MACDFTLFSHPIKIRYRKQPPHLVVLEQRKGQVLNTFEKIKQLPGGETP